MKYEIMVRDVNWQYRRVGTAQNSGGFWRLELQEAVKGQLLMRPFEEENERITVPNRPRARLPAVRVDDPAEQ